MKDNKKYFALGLGLAFAGIGAVATMSYKLTENLLKLAMDRDVPNNLDSKKSYIAGSTKMEELHNDIVMATESLENKPHEVVSIHNKDGLKLVGHWFENPKAERVIVAMHGWRSSWSHDFCAVADFWLNNGCSVLFAEQQGQGDSDGKYMGFGLIERYDCIDWINWVNSKTKESMPIYLAGISMGATTVLMSAGLKLPDNVNGIMADCGFTSVDRIWKYVMEKNLHFNYSLCSAKANKMCRRRININTDSYSTIDAMKNCKIPVLFIHGTDDKFVPIEMTYENYKVCVAPKRLLVVPGAEHGLCYVTDSQSYEKSVKDFWSDFD